MTECLAAALAAQRSLRVRVVTNLTPQHKAAAIRLLARGDILETESPAAAAKAEDEKKPRNWTRLRGAKMVTPTGLEPMSST